MKKTTKKLTLNTTTVRQLQQNLDAKQLEQIVGGLGERTDGCGSSRAGIC